MIKLHQITSALTVCSSYGRIWANIVYLTQFYMVSLGYEIFFSFDMLPLYFDMLSLFDILSLYFDILSVYFCIWSLSRGWCGMAPEFQINEHITATKMSKASSILKWNHNKNENPLENLIWNGTIGRGGQKNVTHTVEPTTCCWYSPMSNLVLDQ